MLGDVFFVIFDEIPVSVYMTKALAAFFLILEIWFASINIQLYATHLR